MKATVDIGDGSHGESVKEKLEDGGFEVDESDDGRKLFVYGLLEVRSEDNRQTFIGSVERVRILPSHRAKIVRTEVLER